MKKIFLTSSSILICGIAYADYVINFKIPKDTINYYQSERFESLYTDWVNFGDVKSCVSWNPNSDTIPYGVTFTQTSTDCKQEQKRNRQDRKKDPVTNIVSNIGEPVEELRTLNVSSTRVSVGTQMIWTSSNPEYSAWVNKGDIFDCANWLPLPSSVTINQQFNQSSNECKQIQTRTKQEKEQELNTLEIRNVGNPINEEQIILTSSTRSAIGSKETWIAISSTYGDWINNGAISDCTNWSPNVSTVNAGLQFEQTATDCKQNQTRTKQDREQETTTLAVRNKGSVVNESKIINVSATRLATGTKPIEVVPVINSFTGVANWSQGMCAGRGVISWTGSNVITYTLKKDSTTLYTGNANTFTTGYSYQAGNHSFSLTACSSTNTCTSRSLSLTVTKSACK